MVFWALDWADKGDPVRDTLFVSSANNMAVLIEKRLENSPVDTRQKIIWEFKVMFSRKSKLFWKPYIQGFCRAFSVPAYSFDSGFTFILLSFRPHARFDLSFNIYRYVLRIFLLTSCIYKYYVFLSFRSPFPMYVIRSKYGTCRYSRKTYTRRTRTITQYGHSTQHHHDQKEVLWS